jgi:hypothetical protein
MNKNTPVVQLWIDDDTAAIVKVTKALELAYLPIGIDFKTGIPNKKELNEWWFSRSIPASRSGIREALEKLDVTHTEHLLAKCYGLSLSDQYWMKPDNTSLEWSDINFFENSFSDDVGNILFGQPAENENIDLISPCNTSDGWLKKKWKIIDGKRYLIKAGSDPYMQEPLNEAFATKLHERLGGKNYIPYTLLWENGKPYSVCENFITTNTELVSAVSINKSMKKRSQNSTYEHFIQASEKLGIPHMIEFINYLLVFDYFMANTDRHFGNFGAIRNVETLEWIGAAPVFDTGTSLWHNKLTKVINPFDEIESKPFYAKQKKQMELITDFEWIPFENMKGMRDDLQEVFKQSEFMDEQRIEVINNAITDRIQQLQELAMEQKHQITFTNL